jgi:hypothetical protein
MRDRKRGPTKNQLVVDKSCTIVHKAGRKKGCRHDYDVYKKNHRVVPKEVGSVFGLRYEEVK